ncbi:hypothetical protein, partial [Salmonella sp. SAL04269]|uniref:hypothetical protein n=1 Tax=Salmonella sp. SAL04269 TaxID=3159847 RepID=UPI003979A64E
LGLDALGTSIAAVVFLLLAWVAWRLPRWLARRGGASVEETEAPTLAEAGLAPAADTAAPSPTGPPPMPSAAPAVSE